MPGNSSVLISSTSRIVPFSGVFERGEGLSFFQTHRGSLKSPSAAQEKANYNLQHSQLYKMGSSFRSCLFSKAVTSGQGHTSRLHMVFLLLGLSLWSHKSHRASLFSLTLPPSLPPHLPLSFTSFCHWKNLTGTQEGSQPRVGKFLGI